MYLCDKVWLEYRLVGACPFFVDRYLVMHAIEHFHPSAESSRNPASISSNFLVGNGENGLWGKVALRATESDNIPLAKTLRERINNEHAA